MSSLAFFILGVVVLYLIIGACFAWRARGGLGLIAAMVITLSWPIYVRGDL